MDRIRAFLAAVRIDGGALLVTGETGVGKTGLLNAAAEAAAAVGMRGGRPGGVGLGGGHRSALGAVVLLLAPRAGDAGERFVRRAAPFGDLPTSTLWRQVRSTNEKVGRKPRPAGIGAHLEKNR
jgi:hypothetical protein